MKEFKDLIEFTNKMRILYVEDEVELMEVTLEILQDLFLEVIIAKNGEDALDRFYAEKIDLVLTDINLPNFSGLEIAERIRSFDKNIPIVVVSAYSEIKYFTKAIELGIDGYLSKPLEMDNFFSILKKVVQKMQFLEEYNNNLAFLRQYQEITDNNAAVSKTNTKGLITYVNERFCKLSGYSVAELIGQNHNIIRHPDNPASLYTDLWHTIKFKKLTWQGIIRNIAKNGGIYYTNTIITPILDMNDNIVEYISMKHDVTHILNPKKQLYDFVGSAENPMVVLMKIDGFADIEKLYGHSLTSEIEENFADQLKKTIPDYLGFVKFFHVGNGRYVFAQDLALQDTLDMQIMYKELRGFQSYINELKVDVGEIDYDIAVLISVANGENCIENMEYGMNLSIKSKQDFIVSNGFAELEQNEALNNLKILKMVKIALDESKVISYFQPIVCNDTKEIVKYESLVRLIDGEGKIVLPSLFLSIAKRGKYYSRITGMVLENSFNALTKTTKAIAVNISALDIEKLSTRDKIYELLLLHRNNASRMVFELLEDEDVKDFDEIEKFITTVKEYGVRIAIDDFGAGYSNFERLLKYQPDILKIDGSLIKNIETDSYSMSVIKSIVAFAKEQGLEMVAEYVENENMYKILKDLGVEYSQGYYFGKPDIVIEN